MNSIYTNAAVGDEIRRNRLYEGDLFVYSASSASRRLVQHAADMIEEVFPGNDPVYAQYTMPVEEYVAIVAALKPRFIHHPKTKSLITGVLEEIGCDLDLTYQDVPRLRMVTSGGYLTSGVGYAHHPHRDTWYSAPMSQINWWLPIYPMESSSAMAFHENYWQQPLKNTSYEFNYYQWNAQGRAKAAQHIKSDTRNQPKAVEPVDLDPHIRIVPEPGGIIMFSAAQLHSTVPNTSGKTRYSLDFRTVHIGDLRNGIAPPNIDSNCTGTSLRDFLKAGDLSPFPDDVVAMHDSGPVAMAEPLVFRPSI
jgi:hypothetical protein